eukprot:SAG31_NODE_13532_length_863_cov_1.193717_1_plen_270_part_01
MVKASIGYIVEAAVWELGKMEPVASAPRERAQRCLQFLAKCTNNRSVETLLKNNLRAVLANLNGHLITPQYAYKQNAASSQNGNHALRSLEGVIEIMKSNLVNFLPAITSTLKIVLGRPSLQLPALNVWYTLVQCVPAQFFGPHLSQIVGHLLPILPSYPEQCLRVLEHLMVQQRNLLKQHFCELSFLPQDAQLQIINSSIEKEVGTLTVPQRLQQLCIAMENESVTVRTLSLMQLLRILKMNWKAVAQLVRGPTELVHPVISDLVTLLR